MDSIIYLVPVLAVVGLLYMVTRAMWVTKQEAGTDRMKEIAGYVAEGAMSFLKAEYRILAIYVVIAGAALGYLSQIVATSHILIVVAFVIGCFFSALAGFVGMRIATKANVRTTNAARTSLAKALRVSFTGGSVMGLGVAGLAVLGLSMLFIFFFNFFMNGTLANGGYESMTRVLEVLAGFSLGAESIALFARVGGGIYTKAADVGADLVGKVEAGIPEDDPRNPATIADNVGDNVGDVAGMGADLFGSYVATVLASMVLGNYVIRDFIAANSNYDAIPFHGLGPIFLPLCIAAIGIIASIIGTFLVNVKDNGTANINTVQRALNNGNWVSIILSLVASYFLIHMMLPESMTITVFNNGAFGSMITTSSQVFYAVIIGMFVGAAISYITEYFTAIGKGPVNGIVQKSGTGAATNIIAGLGTGMLSTAMPVVLFAGAIWGAYALAGFYGVGIAASAMMANTAMQLAIDAFGPIADNAGGIAEMSELPSEVRERTDILDSVGNTTAAIGKGFAIASAALTALALFAAYVTITGIKGINIFEAKVLSALFIGGMIPVVFSALAMNSVGRAAMDMVNEVRRQFREIPGIMEGKGKPEYGKCVEISTKAALRQMLLPGCITIVTPVLVGLIMGAEALGAYMAGVTVSGVLWAIFQNNAGGAWDNAKKSFEKGVDINGEMFYKKSEPHKAAVVGDTVGDPFKDTSGPSMNILIKLSCLVGLTLAPLLHENSSAKSEAVSVVSEVKSPSADITAMNGLYPVDAGHSFIEFTIKHWMGRSVGTMHIDSGAISMTGTPATSTMELWINPSSINTMNSDRDEEMRGEKWFDVTKNPSIYFKSSSITEQKNNVYRYVANGNLSMKGVTKTISVPFNYLGEVDTKHSSMVYIFDGEMTVNRVDFNIGAANLPFLSDEARISFSLEAKK